MPSLIKLTRYLLNTNGDFECLKSYQLDSRQTTPQLQSCSALRCLLYTHWIWIWLSPSFDVTIALMTNKVSLLYMQLVQECVAYEATHGFCANAFAFSGVLCMLAGIRPALATKLLLRCPLNRADWVLVKVFLLTAKPMLKCTTNNLCCQSCCIVTHTSIKVSCVQLAACRHD